MVIESIFAGFGGQGVLLMGYLLALTGMNEGKEVTYLPSYGAEVRGGTANCTVVVSSEEIASPVTSSPNFLVAMNKPSFLRFFSSVRSDGMIILNGDLVNQEDIDEQSKILSIPASTIANKLGESRSANIVVMGAFAFVTKIATLDSFKQTLAATKLGKKKEIFALNCEALEAGAEIAYKNL